MPRIENILQAGKYTVLALDGPLSGQEFLRINDIAFPAVYSSIGDLASVGIETAKLREKGIFAKVGDTVADGI